MYNITNKDDKHHYLPMITDRQQIDRLFLALGEHLQAAKSASIELVVCGGTALNALGLVSRPTRDVDIVAIIKCDRGSISFVTAKPLPSVLKEAAEKVAMDYHLIADWLNPGATDLLEFGLPDGFQGRLHTVSYGPLLKIHFAGRVDLIYFKLYALADQGPGGRHEEDLLKLEPTPEELISAVAWCLSQDPSEAFRMVLRQALEQLGAGDVARSI
jgi:hypothetical protein